MPALGGLAGWLALAAAVLPELSAAASDAAEEQAALAALAADGQCDGAGADGACALSVLQLRGQKVVGADNATDESAAWGSCLAYGCSGYKPGSSCQCNSKCTKYHNCCTDYWATCTHHAQGGSCLAWGCGYKPGQSCQCNGKCTKYHNCCSDYWAKCTAPAGAGGSPDPAAAASPHHAGRKIYGHPKPGFNYPQHPGFSLMLVEEFDAPLDLDSDPIWTWSDGGLQEGQTRFVKEQIKFRGGKMIIEMANQPAAHAQSCSHAEKKVIAHKGKVSGEIRTRHNMFRYGYYEVRMRAPDVKPGNPSVNGNFVSTMFVFRDGKFKHWREIDVEVTGDTKGQVSTNVLVAENQSEWSADMEHGKIWQVPFNVRSDFHTYGFEWLPNRIRWYSDGKMIREWKGVIPELSTKIMMNLWMFDKRALFGGKMIWNDVFPTRSEYEWFRFYKWDGDHNYPCAGMGTHCLTADDWYLSGNNPCDGVKQMGTVKGKGVCTATCR